MRQHESSKAKAQEDPIYNHIQVYNDPIALAKMTSDPIFGSMDVPLPEHKFALGGRKIVTYPDPDDQGLDEDIKWTQKNLLDSQKFWGHNWVYNMSANMPNFAIPGKPMYMGEPRTDTEIYKLTYEASPMPAGNGHANNEELAKDFFKLPPPPKGWYKMLDPVTDDSEPAFAPTAPAPAGIVAGQASAPSQHAARPEVKDLLAEQLKAMRDELHEMHNALNSRDNQIATLKQQVERMSSAPAANATQPAALTISAPAPANATNTLAAHRPAATAAPAQNATAVAATLAAPVPANISAVATAQPARVASPATPAANQTAIQTAPVVNQTVAVQAPAQNAAAAAAAGALPQAVAAPAQANATAAVHLQSAPVQALSELEQTALNSPLNIQKHHDE